MAPDALSVAMEDLYGRQCANVMGTVLLRLGSLDEVERCRSSLGRLQRGNGRVSDFSVDRLIRRVGLSEFMRLGRNKDDTVQYTS